MKKINIYIVSVAAICLIGIYAFKINHIQRTVKTVEVHGNYVLYNNVENLENYADAIIIGSVTSELKDNKVVTTKNVNGRLDNFYTITPINVKKVIKGDIVNRTINVNQPVAIIKDSDNSDIKLVLEDYSELKKNANYVLFLKKATDNSYSIVSVSQGKFNLDDTDADEKNIASNNSQLNELKQKVLKKYK